jgi:hypothetical protein
LVLQELAAVKAEAEASEQDEEYGFKSELAVAEETENL